MLLGIVPPLPLRYRAWYLLLRYWQDASHEKQVLQDLQGNPDMKTFAWLTSQKIINKGIKSDLSCRLIFLPGSEQMACPCILTVKSQCCKIISYPYWALILQVFLVSILLKFKTCLSVLLLICLLQSISGEMVIFINDLLEMMTY